jgi:hypothetical protein
MTCLDIARTGHAEEDDIGAARHLGRGLHFAGALGDQPLHRFAAAIRHHQQRIALGQEVGRHPFAHKSEPDEADGAVRHGDNPSLGVCI